MILRVKKCHFHYDMQKKSIFGSFSTCFGSQTSKNMYLRITMSCMRKGCTSILQHLEPVYRREINLIVIKCEVN
jgi:hypothetical protein